MPPPHTIIPSTVQYGYSVPPSGGVRGSLFYNTFDTSMYVWDATAWRKIAAYGDEDFDSLPWHTILILDKEKRKKHRIDGPAVVTRWKNKKWFVNSILHRIDGYANLIEKRWSLDDMTIPTYMVMNWCNDRAIDPQDFSDEDMVPFVMWFTP